jgi:hypothetical protein
MAIDAWEGGYAGVDIGVSTVWNFISKFTYEQYYWAAGFMFRENNNSYVDLMDFAFYCGHGNRWLISEPNGTIINLSTAGNNSNNGWGQWARYVALYSCLVVASPLEVTDWWTPWINEPGGVFDGVRQVLGYRTNAAVATGPNIGSYYGQQMRNSNYVAQSWMNANNLYGDLSYMRTSIVMHSSAVNDQYNSASIPAAPDDGSLYIIWQN